MYAITGIGFGFILSSTSDGPSLSFPLQAASINKAAKAKYDDPTISPVIRQGLLQWAYTLVSSDF